MRVSGKVNAFFSIVLLKRLSETGANYLQMHPYINSALCNSSAFYFSDDKVFIDASADISHWSLGTSIVCFSFNMKFFQVISQEPYTGRISKNWSIKHIVQNL